MFIKKFNLLFFLIFYSSFISEFKINKLKEVSNNQTSFNLSVRQINNDLTSKLHKVQKLYEDSEFEEALKYALELLEILNKEDYIYNYKINSIIAKIYFKVNNKELSLLYHKKTLANLLLLNNLDNQTSYPFSKDIARTYHLIGSMFQSMKKQGKSFKEFQLSDSAKYYYNKVISLPSLNNIILDIKARSFANLSGVYETDSLYFQAEKYAIKAIEIQRKLNNKLSEAKALNNLGNIYLSQENFEKSKEIYFEAIKLLENHNSSLAINIKASLYFNLAWAMRNLRDFEAYDNLEKSYKFEEKIRDVNMMQVIKQITAENDVEIVKKVEENKRLIQERKFWFSLGTSFVIIIFLTFCVMFYHQRKKTLALQLEKADFIQKQKIDTYKSELQTKVLNATIDGKESERKEIAESLHDNVSALLSSANLHLQASKKHFDEKIPEEIYKSQQIINEASKKVRDLSHNLVSSILLKFGLSFAIRDIVGKYSNSSLKINSDVENVGRYNQKFEIKTFNIIQEFLNNILKHSKAKEANVCLKEENNNIIIKISDNGIGFDKSKITEKDGVGINQIKARIKIMKGNFYLQTKKGSGTEIKVVLPVQEKMEEVSA